MEERTANLTIGNKTYTLILTLKATKMISERFGGLSKMGEALAEASTDNIDTLTWLIAILANQSVLRHNFENHEHLPEVTQEEIELMFEPKDLIAAKDAVLNCMIAGTKREVESEPEKN